MHGTCAGGSPVRRTAAVDVRIHFHVGGLEPLSSACNILTRRAFRRLSASLVSSARFVLLRFIVAPWLSAARRSAFLPDWLLRSFLLVARNETGP